MYREEVKYDARRKDHIKTEDPVFVAIRKTKKTKDHARYSRACSCLRALTSDDPGHQKLLSDIVLSSDDSIEKKKRKADELKLWAGSFLEKYEGRRPKRITIREMSSRWGSCSSSGNISLNLYLYEVDESLREYVLIHELSHLYQMNHSPLFWNKVSEICPDYRERRKALRKYRLPGKR